MKIVFGSVLVIAFLLVLGSPALTAQDPVNVQKVPPGDLKGVLKDSKGKPFTDVEMSIVDKNGDIIQKTMTNAKGEYTFANLPEGDFALHVAGKPTFSLQVIEGASAGTVQAVVPAVARDGATGALAPAALTTLEWTLIIVGGVAVAVGVPAIINHNNNNNDDDKSVSP